MAKERFPFARFSSMVLSVVLALAVALGPAALAGCAAEEAASSSAVSERVSSSSVEASAGSSASSEASSASDATKAPTLDLAAIPSYTGSPYVEVDGNAPAFTSSDKARASFEEYAPLDRLGRCGVAFALVGVETMPTAERGSIGEVRPSGWHTVKYPEVIEDNYLYNRCHLLGYQLTGENANERNLITGTRSFNVDGMLPFENEIADYVDRTGNHVLYRVTPLFVGDELVARGVQMEALSVEDDGAGVRFNVFCYNVQPGIVIDYATGESRLEEQMPAADAGSDTTAGATEQADYVLNTNTGKFHVPSCSSADDIKSKNRQDFHGQRSDVIAQGYVPCKRCNP